jgi:ribose transport system substrate-binding protein
MNSARGRRLPVVFFAVLGVVLFASTFGASARPSARTRTATAPDLAGAQAAINKYKHVPVFAAPGPAINVKALRGQTIFSVPSNSAVPFVSNVFTGEAQATKAAGVTYKQCPTQGQVSQWGACMSQAIGQKVKLISAFVPGNLIGPQLAQAKAAGIPVVNTGFDNRGTVPKGFAAIADQDNVLPGQLLADYAIVLTHAKVDAVVFHTTEITGDDILIHAMQQEFAKRCGSSCKIRLIDVNIADWGSKIQTELQSAITADRNVNLVIPVFDGMATSAIAGINGANAASRVKLITYNGTPSVLKQIGQSGSPVVMDIGQPTYWIGWNQMDQAFRVMLHAPLGQHGDGLINGQPSNPIRIFDASNRSSLGANPTPASGYGTSYIVGYLKLWGVGK